MSEQNNTLTRRNFLKGAASLSALSIGGLAFAGSGVPAVDAISGNNVLSASGIRIIQETMPDREKVTLINQSDKLQMLDVRQPIALHQANGRLVVSVNQDDAEATNGMMVMSPGQRLTFDVNASGIEVSASHLQISSRHPVFNRTVPVQIA